MELKVGVSNKDDIKAFKNIKSILTREEHHGFIKGIVLKHVFPDIIINADDELLDIISASADIFTEAVEAELIECIENMEGRKDAKEDD